MTALAIIGGLVLGYALGRCGWFLLVLVFDGEG